MTVSKRIRLGPHETRLLLELEARESDLFTTDDARKALGLRDVAPVLHRLRGKGEGSDQEGVRDTSVRRLTFSCGDLDGLAAVRGGVVDEPHADEGIADAAGRPRDVPPLPRPETPTKGLYT